MKKIEEMIRKVEYIETHDTNRHGLGSREEKKMHLSKKKKAKRLKKEQE